MPRAREEAHLIEPRDLPSELPVEIATRLAAARLPARASAPRDNRTPSGGSTNETDWRDNDKVHDGHEHRRSHLRKHQGESHPPGVNRTETVWNQRAAEEQESAKQTGHR